MFAQTEKLITPRTHLNARELSGLLLAVCDVATLLRQRGSCMGSDISQWIEVGEGALRLRPLPRRRAKRKVLSRAQRHAVLGHDNGCLAFGVSAGSLVELLHPLDGRSVLPLMLESFNEAVFDVMSEAPHWSRASALESIEIQLYSRVTPTSFDVEGYEIVSGGTQKGGFSTP